MSMGNLHTNREPRADIIDPNTCGCQAAMEEQEIKEDAHDRFVRLTGGDRAQRTGHNVAAFEKKIDMPDEKIDGGFYYGPVGICAPVSQPLPSAEDYSAETAPAAPRKRKSHA